MTSSQLRVVDRGLDAIRPSDGWAAPSLASKGVPRSLISQFAPLRKRVGCESSYAPLEFRKLPDSSRRQVWMEDQSLAVVGRR